MWSFDLIGGLWTEFRQSWYMHFNESLILRCFFSDRDLTKSRRERQHRREIMPLVIRFALEAVKMFLTRLNVVTITSEIQ